MSFFQGALNIDPGSIKLRRRLTVTRPTTLDMPRANVAFSASPPSCPGTRSRYSASG